MSTHSRNSAISSQDSYGPEVSIMQPTSDLTIQQQPVGSSRIKELRSHQCIKIKWSLDSDSRRRIGLPPVAAVGAVAPGTAAAGGGSC